MIVDCHTHLLPDRLAVAIRRFFSDHGVADTDAVELLGEHSNLIADLTPVTFSPVLESICSGNARRLIGATA